MKRVHIKQLLLCGLVSFSVARADVRQQIVDTLASIQPTGAGTLTAWLNDDCHRFDKSGSRVLRLGESVHFHLTASPTVHLIGVTVDSQGVAMLFDAGVVEAGKVSSFPAEGVFEVEPPLGNETIFFFGTRSPVRISGFGDPGGPRYVDSDDAVRLADSLKRDLERSGKLVASARIGIRIGGRTDEVYTVDDVVSFFTGPRSRSIDQSKFGYPVHFETDSVELGAEARRSLDVMGRALTTVDLRDKHFVIQGHTDERGSSEYNDKLSKGRAEAVHEYLVSTWGIDKQRLSVEYYGESIPWELGSNEEAWQMNRRVEFVWKQSESGRN